MIKRSLGLALIKRSLGRLLLKMAWGAPRARALNFSPKRLTAILFPIKLGCSTKSTCAGSWRKDDDQAQISNPPPSWRSLRNPITGAPRAETEAFFPALRWLAPQKARAREVAQRLMTGRNFLSPPPLTARSAIRSRECQCAETEAFFQYGLQSIFELSWLALKKAHAREVSATMMTNQITTPPLRSRACRVRGNRSFFPMWPAAILFPVSWLALQKARRGANFQAPPLMARSATTKSTPPPLGARSAIRGNWPAAVLLRAQLARPTKRTRAGSCATMMTRRKFLEAPPLMARSAIRSRECHARGN